MSSLFSFGNYYEPEKNKLWNAAVLNDDVITVDQVLKRIPITWK